MSIKRTNFKEDYYDLVEVIALGKFLVKLSVPGATEFVSDADDLHSDTFCGECTAHQDECNCGKYSYDSEYDDGADYYDDV